ncbi:MAG: DUF4406 domain-containing protein [Tepidanaerobacter acetatoxydans]|uniref:nucleoside 2-deoxyribosyltransferase domain-containing protein n=1 Tax=Tepidanaerobacter acetatoxydans TaxID=499229 RepID=UPI0026F35606|nr:nucleoside 2-deoxyribosyltransferase domain-containing protein [Tepidanaerobacter acetatoxydans]NLU09416.1 DUF4406 domain-containing protein [Tepidanaerobacter acetatoxydans]
MLNIGPTVYLAGSINGHKSWELVTTWRTYAEKILEAAGYRVLNPVRGRSPTDTDSKDIVERDLQDIAKADILLVEMDHEDKAYIGTAMEIRYAWERGKEIIIWGRANRESHWLKYHTHVRCNTLGQALEYLLKRKVRNECFWCGGNMVPLPDESYICSECGWRHKGMMQS